MGACSGQFGRANVKTSILCSPCFQREFEFIYFVRRAEYDRVKKQARMDNLRSDLEYQSSFSGSGTVILVVRFDRQI